MKMSRLFSIALLGVALAVTPVYAQRGGGGGGRSGGGHSSGSVSSSRGGGGGFSSSRSGSSYSSSRSSSSSYSGSRSGSSYSGSRSSSSYSGSRSNSSYSGSSLRSSSSPATYSSSRSESSSFGSRSDNAGSGISRSSNHQSRTGSVPAQIRSRSGNAQGGVRERSGDRNGFTQRGDNPSRSSGNVTHGRPSGVAPTPAGGYARPGNPNGPMPPSHRPMHPAPYFMHPCHHHMVHCHRLYWDPFPPRPWFWPGFWFYCNNYWYDYHVTDVVVVREYARSTYNVDLITYAISGDYMYALINDPDGHTYLQIYDKNDKLLAEQQVSRKYCKMQVDPENGGCWIMKKRDKDPLLFFYTPEGQLLIYEADK